MDMKWISAKFNDKPISDSSIQTRAATTQLQSEGDILSESGGDTKLQGTQVKAQNFTVNAGVGPKADPNAKIIIEGVKETLQTSHTEKSGSLMWQSMSGNGVTEETLKLVQINAKTKFSAPGGIDVQLPAGDPLKQQVQSLSQQPGMAWLNDLSQRKDVNWQQIKLAKDSWSYDQQGLTPAGAAILAIAIAAYTGGMGAELLGGTAATSTSAATLMGSTVYGAAANAGFAALASSAGVSFVNNGGDIGKTLKDMGSSQNVKGVLTAMATAGVLNALGSTPTATGQTGANAQAISTTHAVDKFTANLMQNVTNNMASAVVSSAINGTPLNEDTLSTALSSALITAGTAQAANNIGAATQNGTLNAYTQAMAHALAGCVGGAATTGNSGGCSAGAVGAVVGELTMKFTTDNEMTGSNALKLAASMSAVAGAMVGGPNSAAAVNVASQMGTNAALNNFCAGQSNCEGRRFTFSDAVAHWRSGNGTPITDVNASELNLKGATFTKISDGVYLVHTSLAYDTGAIYGTVTGFLNPDGTMSFKPDTRVSRILCKRSEC
jgi:large exoprotein involved in heme utilization and adhesion